MSRFGRQLVGILAATSLATVMLAVPVTADNDRVLVVDDDGMQCGNWDHQSIQAAVDEAEASDQVTEIRVCPGIYAESVTVEKELVIRGNADSVEAIDCFASVQPTLNPQTQAIVGAVPGGTASAPAVIFDLQADNITLQGLVLTGQLGSSFEQLRSAAVMTSDDNSGYRIHHNLFIGNRVAAFLRSNGSLPSLFDHNCVRDNSRGIANHYLPLVNARIHHNSTFRTASFAYEQTGFCPGFLETGSLDTCFSSQIGMDGVLFDHNASIDDGPPPTVLGMNIPVFKIASSSSTTLSSNTVVNALIGVRVFGANIGLRIIDNRLDVRQGGVARPSNPGAGIPPQIDFLAPNVGATIQGNTITRTASVPSTVNTAGIGIGTRGLKNSAILANVITGFTLGSTFSGGIVLSSGNTGNLLLGNYVTNNANGILLDAGATENTVEANTMLNNELLDANDATGVAGDPSSIHNTWLNNICDSDFPDGLCPTP
jgi:parallel beta-helix repeat protein